jgi:hypothetical protein
LRGGLVAIAIAIDLIYRTSASRGRVAVCWMGG